MAASLIDMLAPEAQHLLGGSAVAVTLLGASIWSAGIKLARAAVAILAGLLTAALAAWLLPQYLGLATLTAGIAGFALGALAGALAFRILQGLILALCLGLAVAGGYYHWHVTPPPPAATQTQPVDISDLLIKGPLVDSPPAKLTAVQTARDDLTTFGHKLVDRWNDIDQKDRTRMLIAGIGTAAVVLLLAFGFAKHVTLVVSSILGTAMILAGADAAAHVFAPALQNFFPDATLLRYGVIAAIVAVGIGVQWLLFWPRESQAKAQKGSAKGEQSAKMGRPTA